jgi:hypothetical protein
MRTQQIQLLSAIGETFIPPRRPGDWHGGDRTSMAIIIDYYSRGPWFMRLAFVAAGVLINLTPPLLLGKLSTFCRLSPELRERHLNRFARTMPFALVFAPLRAFLALAIYSRPDAIAETGYHNRGKQVRV